MEFQIPKDQGSLLPLSYPRLNSRASLSPFCLRCAGNGLELEASLLLRQGLPSSLDYLSLALAYRSPSSF